MQLSMNVLRRWAWMFFARNAVEHGRTQNVCVDVVGPGCKPGLRHSELQTACNRAWM